ncbi:MAG: nickel transport protein [Desulforhopalus sp.]|jgi:nickel transport protein
MISKSVISNITKALYMLLFMSGVIALYTTTASAHGLGYRLLKNDTTEVVEFRYSNGSALPFAEVEVWSPDDAEVEVWSPDDAEIEFQNGRTDKNGRFSFFPDVPGIWRVILPC